MNENTKILVLAGLVLVVAIVSFNLNITGKVVACSEDTIISVSPSKVVFDENDASKIINVAIKNIGNEGIDKDIKLYKSNGVRLEGNAISFCTDYQCYEDSAYSFKVSANLKDGEYYFVATRDNYGCKYTSNTFTVE